MKLSRKLVVLVLASLTAMGGIYLQRQSDAASAALALEAEDGVRTAQVTTVHDMSASNMSAVSFGSGGSYQNPGGETAVMPPPPYSGGSGGPGEFVASCEVTHRAADDPIVLPNQPGKSHSHDFFGSPKVSAFTLTSASLQGGGTSCPDRPGDTAGYWAPTLYGDDKEVTPKRIRVYYRAGGKDSRTIYAFPAGLKVVAGTATAKSPQPLNISSWACTIEGGGDAGDEVEVEDVPVCPASSPSLRLRIVFPDCWDGKNLDSPNHKDHMSYRTRSTCPTTHPIPVPQMTVGIRYWYDTAFPRNATIRLASGGVYSGHADFFNGWHQKNLEALVRECINKAVKCGDVSGPRP